MKRHGLHEPSQKKFLDPSKQRGASSRRHRCDVMVLVVSPAVLQVVSAAAMERERQQGTQRETEGERGRRGWGVVFLPASSRKQGSAKRQPHRPCSPRGSLSSGIPPLHSPRSALPSFGWKLLCRLLVGRSRYPIAKLMHIKPGSCIVWFEGHVVPYQHKPVNIIATVCRSRVRPTGLFHDHSHILALPSTPKLPRSNHETSRVNEGVDKHQTHQRAPLRRRLGPPSGPTRLQLYRFARRGTRLPA